MDDGTQDLFKDSKRIATQRVPSKSRRNPLPLRKVKEIYTFTQGNQRINYRNYNWGGDNFLIHWGTYGSSSGKGISPSISSSHWSKAQCQH